MKKSAIYHTDQGPITVDYDSEDPCRICGLSVEDASVGGTNVCPWCDMGRHRDGRPWTYLELLERSKS